MKTRLGKAYDVIVAGGGPAGCAAAAAAARLGMRTLLLEASFSLGGMGTGGLVTCFAPFGDGVRQISCGVAGEVLRQSNASAYHTPIDAIGWVPTDPEALRRIYDELVISSGAEVLFGTLVCGAEVENATVTSILAANKAGLTEYQAQAFIDCTGDADLCAHAGAAFEISSECQPASLCFILANVNLASFDAGCMNGGHPGSPIHRILARGGKYPLIRDTHLCIDVLGEGIVAFNAGHIQADGTDPASVAQGMMEGRRMAAQFRDALAEVMPEAFGRAQLIATAPLLGVRESRRIVGEYTVTLEDYLTRREFPDGIARNCYFLDVHSMAGHTPGMAAAGEPYAHGESHAIPYRCMIPRGYKNLLAAGRAVSCDHVVQGSLRVMPNCLTMGQAAGTAAALAVRDRKSVGDISVVKLRQLLQENGAYL